MEGTHGELGTGLADGLGRDDADGFAHFNHFAGAQVATVAEFADAALGLAGENGTDLDLLDTGGLDLGGLGFVDLLVDVDDDLAVDALELFARDTADDAVAQRLDDFAGFDDGHDEDAVGGAAVGLGDDDVLRDVDETAGEVAGVGRLERGVGETLTRAVGRDEVLEHGETFAEVGLDGRFDDFAGGLGHEAAHAGELTNLLFGTTGAGVGHDVDRVHGSFLVGALHVAEHLVRHLFRDGRPHLDDLVVALAVGDGAVEVLLLDGDNLLLGFVDDGVLGRRDDHVRRGRPTGRSGWRTGSRAP